LVHPLYELGLESTLRQSGGPKPKTAVTDDGV